MSEEISFIDKIKERKVIPYFITYLGGCVALIELSDWYCEKNMYSPYWPQLLFYFLLIIIPTVLIILFAISKKGKEKFSKIHYGFIGINLMIALGFLGFMYKQNPLTNLAEKVKVVNENGEETERIIPNIEFTKRIIIFPFETKDPEPNDLLKFGVPFLVSLDVEQNASQFALSPLNLRSYYEKYNRSIDEEVPFNVKKEIATDLYTDVFLVGEYDRKEDLINFRLKCYTTKDGKELFSKTIEAKDEFELSDKITSVYHDNLYTEDYKMSNVTNYTDLPSNSLVSNSLEAYDHFVKGLVLSEHKSKYIESIQNLEKALEIDPNCVECAAQLSTLYIAINNGQKSQEYINIAIQNVDVLSERQQLRIKSSYYLRNNDMAKAISLFEMWKQLYPNNLEPYAFLINFYPIFSGADKAIEVGKEAVELGHKGNFLLSIAQLMASKGDFEGAEDYFNKYQLAFPEKAAEATSLGSIYNQAGRFDDAIAHYQKIELIKPQDYNIKRLIAISEGHKGNLEKEIQLYDEALKLAKNAQDTVRVYRNLESYYQRLGKVKTAFELLDKRYKLMAGYSPPVSIAVEVFQNQTLHKMYENSQNLEGFRKRLEQAKSIFNDPGFVNLIDMVYYQISDDVEGMSEIYSEVREFVLAKSGISQQMAIDITYAFLQKDYQKSLSLMDTLESKIGELDLNQYGTMKALCYKGIGSYEKAFEEYKKHELMRPNAPYILQEIGNLYLETGEPGKAKEYFSKALKILENADPGYLIKDEIIAKMEENNISI